MFDLTNKTVIVVSPHSDDVELGAGGTVHRLLRNRCTVHYVGLSFPPLVDPVGFRAEFDASSKCLGLEVSLVTLRNYDPRNLFESRTEILQLFFDMSQSIKPDLVFIPNSRDIHQSHEVVFAEARRAFKYTTLLGYELPWNSMDFPMHAFITLAKEDVDAKIAAINCFATQKKRMFFSNDIVGDLARVRGKQIGHDYAECFEVIRSIS